MLHFIEQKVFFEHCREVQTIKNLLIDIAMTIFSDDLFRADPYRFMLVLHKDVLYHYEDAKYFFLF
jgi:hypothetical protein